MKRFFLAALLVLLAGLAAGCGTTTSTPTNTQAAQAPANLPTAISIDAGKGGLAGQVVGAAARWSGETVLIFAAPFTAVDSAEQGFYVLEPEIHPHTALDADGAFQLGGVEPGTYVLVVGPTAREGKLVINESGTPQIFTVKSGELLPAGNLTLAD